MSGAVEHRLLTKWERLARVFSKNHAVRVELTGAKCDMDGTTIRLPANADYLKEEDQRVLEGLLDHEWLHVHEEQEAKARKEISPRSKTPLEMMETLPDDRTRAFFNGFEDVRIEARGAAMYAGVRDNLDRALDFSVRLLRKEKDKPRSATSILTAGLFVDAKRQPLDWMPDELRWVLEEQLADLVDKSREVHSPEECAELAIEAARRLKELEPELKKEIARRSPEKKEGEEAGSSTPLEEFIRELEGHRDAPSSPEEVPSPEETPLDLSESKREEEARDEALDKLSDDALEKLIAALKLDESAKDAGGLFAIAKEHIEKSAIDDRRRHRRWMPDPEVAARDRITKPSEKDRTAYLEARAKLGPQIRTLRAKLNALLRVRALDRLACDQEHGLLDETALYMVPRGDRRVFMQRIKGLPIDTAVEVLIDLSGSMRDGGRGTSRADYARFTAIALAEAMDVLKIPFEILGFHNDGDDCFDERPHTGDWSRFLPFEFRLFKGWDEQLRKCQGRFAAITPGAQNVDGEAVMFAARRLARRTEARKILIVLSDGEPCGGGHTDEMNAHLGEVVTRVSRAGIEVLGIGMQSKAVERFYAPKNGARYVVVKDMDALAITVFQLFKRRMIEGVEDGPS